jgi:integrase
VLTGARYGELCALHVCDFRGGKLHIKYSKSGKPRDVILTEEGQSFFEQICAGRAADAYMFLRDDGEPWKRSQQARLMHAACKAARIAPAISFHALRHTYASLCVMAEMPLAVLAQNLGHASTRMIEAHYGHLRQTYIDEAVQRSAPRFGLVEQSKVVSAKLARR